MLEKHKFRSLKITFKLKLTPHFKDFYINQSFYICLLRLKFHGQNSLVFEPQTHNSNSLVLFMKSSQNYHCVFPNSYNLTKPDINERNMAM